MLNHLGEQRIPRAREKIRHELLERLAQRLGLSVAVHGLDEALGNPKPSGAAVSALGDSDDGVVDGAGNVDAQGNVLERLGGVEKALIYPRKGCVVIINHGVPEVRGIRL